MNIPDKKLNQLIDKIDKLDELISLVPDIQKIVKERQEQEIFNKKAAKLGRQALLIAGAVGTFIGAMWAVSKLIFTLGSNQ